MNRLLWFLASSICIAMGIGQAADMGGRNGGTLPLRPGVVVDYRARLVFMMTPGTKIEALELTSGTVVWSSTEAHKPLWATHELLLSQVETFEAGHLELVVMSVPDRGAVVARYDVKLPETVYGTIDAGPNRMFEAKAVEADGNLFVVWSQRSRPISGRPGSESTVSVQQGAFRFDLRSGVVDPVDPKIKTVDLKPMTPDLNKNERLPGFPDVQFRSADNAHVLVSKQGADNRVWDRYEWTLVDRSSSDRVGQFSNHQAHAPFLVIDQMLLFESTPYKLREGDNLVSYPLEILAVDLSTGQLRWRHSVRNTTYEGDLPP